jgi:small subunit ribosomal protein S8
MSMQDLMSDYVARINNSIQSKSPTVNVLKNNLAVAVTTKLTKLGFFASFEVVDREVIITLAKKTTKLIRISKPGRRVYTSYLEIPKLFGGKGFYLVSTSKGVLTNIEARESKIGGEIILSIY